MKYGYARVSTDGQSVDAQVRQLTKAGCKKVFREVASGAKSDRSQLRRVLDLLDRGHEHHGTSDRCLSLTVEIRPVHGNNNLFPRSDQRGTPMGKASQTS